jgi:hypothetical protein
VKLLDDPRCKPEILARIRGLRPNLMRRWGKMNAAQMVCHLNDCFFGVMGDKPIAVAPGHISRKAFKWIALYVPFHWPPGVPTRPEFDQQIGGTPPADFETDLKNLLAQIERFTRKPRDFRFQRHPMFLDMSEREWMRWGYLHTDHHLRQFGQ